MAGRITRVLAPAFLQPCQFIYALHRLKCVLAGQVVLAVIDSTSREQYTWIDIICAQETLCDTLAYLVREEGAVIKGVLPDVPGMSSRGHDTVLQLETSRGGRLRLIQSVSSSPLLSIPHYYSTHLMNAVTRDFLVIAYPKLTFIGRGLLTEAAFPAHMDPTSFVVAEEASGVEKQDAQKRGSPSPLSIKLDQWRTLGDDECVRIRLNQRTVGCRSLETVRWTLQD